MNRKTMRGTKAARPIDVERDRERAQLDAIIALLQGSVARLRDTAQQTDFENKAIEFLAGINRSVLDADCQLRMLQNAFDERYTRPSPISAIVVGGAR